MVPDTSGERQLLGRWDAQVRRHLNVHTLADQPLYKEIIARGRKILPLLLSRLDGRSPQWFVALEQIAGTNPITAEHEGRIADMTSDWITWARQEGIIW